jgi:sortase B
MGLFPSKISKARINNLLILLFSTVIVVCLVLIGLWVADGIGQSSNQSDAIKSATTVNEDVIISLLPPGHREDAQYPALPTALPAAEASAATPNSASETPASQITETPLPIINAPSISVDFAALKRKNKDIAAWLYIPGTVISYPVGQTSDEHPTPFYLENLYDGTANGAGTLYIERINSATFTDRLTYMRGHRMLNGSMFGQLYYFAKQDFFEKHPIGQLYTPEGDFYIYFFAAYETDVDDVLEPNPSDYDYQTYINNAIIKSSITAYFRPNVYDTILVLSTCVARKETDRFMLFGVLVPMNP